MKGSEYAVCDGLALGDLIRQREVSAGELAGACLAAVAEVNPTLNAVIEAYDDTVFTAAADAPFAGVPFMLKDIGCTEKGRRCESGSRLLRGWQAPHDTELMRRFRRAGLVNMGRTATSEFACTATVETAVTGATRNPWNLGYSTAGSSGGSAACVASGIVPIAHGSDGGGSIRMPASCCGVVGLKPSRGRVSPAPAGALPGDLSVDFALTRSVRDAAALLDAVAGAAPGDACVVSRAPNSYSEALHDRRTLRIAVTAEHSWDGTTDPQVRAAVEHVATLCEELGHHVEPARPHFDWPAYVEATLDVWSVMTAAGVAWAASETGRNPGPDTLEGHTRSWWERGRRLSALDLASAVETLAAVSRQVGAFFVQFDVLLGATIPTLRVTLGQYDPIADVPSTWYYESSIGNLESTTSLFNCTGQPAMSLPLCTSREGLPIGIHLAGRTADEHTLLALGSQLEEALPWTDRRPATHAATSPSDIGEIA